MTDQLVNNMNTTAATTTPITTIARITNKKGTSEKVDGKLKSKKSKTVSTADSLASSPSKVTVKTKVKSKGKGDKMEKDTENNGSNTSLVSMSDGVSSEKKKKNKNKNIFSDLLKCLDISNTLIQNAYTNITQAKIVHKQLQKLLCKEQKIQEKIFLKKSMHVYKPSGFNKPASISKELSTFFDLPADTLISRVDVGILIIQYIEKHNLKNKSNGRIIDSDEHLTKLLRLGDNQLTYFKLQKYIKYHFDNV